MSEFIQVGQTALRDPLTGDFLPAVPMFVRKEDVTAAVQANDVDIASAFAEKFGIYMKEARKT